VSNRESIFWLACSLLLAMLLSSSCMGASYFSAKTVATYKILPDGTLEASYDSSKEQQGLDLDIENDNGKIKVVKIHVDKSGTNESAIAAALAANMKLIELITALTTAAVTPK
jgi:hypothetical protein